MSILTNVMEEITKTAQDKIDATINTRAESLKKEGHFIDADSAKSIIISLLNDAVAELINFNTNLDGELKKPDNLFKSYRSQLEDISKYENERTVLGDQFEKLFDAYLSEWKEVEGLGNKAKDPEITKQHSEFLKEKSS